MPARSVTSNLPRVFAILTFALIAVSAPGQSTEADLKGRLLNKPLYLRGLWAEDSLKFDSDGKIRTKSTNRPFTVCGVDIHHIQLKSDKLVLTGDRAGLELAPMKRIPLEETIQVEIAAPPAGDYGAALDQIFATDLADLTPSLPVYWQPYALKHFLPAPEIVVEPAPTLPRLSGVTNPVLLKSVEPSFSPLGRRYKYGGDVVLHFVVRPDGTVSEVRVTTPLGLGMDEQAIAALYGYRFKPAMLNGQPVSTELQVNVNFKIF
jgi:TonB family protein